MDVHVCWWKAIRECLVGIGGWKWLCGVVCCCVVSLRDYSGMGEGFNTYTTTITN